MEWYLFDCRECLEDNGAFKTRMWRSGRRGNISKRNTGRKYNYSDLIGWNDIGGFGKSTDARSHFYTEVSYLVERMEVSNLISPLSPILPTQHCYQYKYIIQLFQEYFMQVVKNCPLIFLLLHLFTVEYMVLEHLHP